MNDLRMVRIVPPSGDRERLLRPAAGIVRRALSASWRSDGPEAALDGLAVMRPYTQWIGKCDIVVDETYLRLLLSVLERCMSGDVEHPLAASFRMDGPTLARTMMLARVGEDPGRSRMTMMLAEEPNPWMPPRLHQRDPRSRTSGISVPMAVGDETERWSRLAPPAVQVFISDEQAGASGARMPMTVSLIPVLHIVRIEDLMKDPVARLRATAMLSEGGKEQS